MEDNLEALSAAMMETMNPDWLHDLLHEPLNTELYDICEIHDESVDDIATIYCINHRVTMCARCRSENQNLHENCRFLPTCVIDGMIAVQVQDIEDLIHCSRTQVHMENSVGFVYLWSWAVDTPHSSNSPRCLGCPMELENAGNRYCSLECQLSTSTTEEMFRTDIRCFIVANLCKDLT